MAKKIFISHSSKDNVIAEKMYAFLKEEGLDPWLDTHDIEPGVAYAKAIIKGLDNSDMMVVICSKDSFESSDVLNEIDQAHAKDMPIFPFLIDDSPMNGEFRYYLSRKQWIKAEGNAESHFKRLSKAIMKQCGGPRGELQPTPIPVPQAPINRRSLVNELTDTARWKPVVSILELIQMIAFIAIFIAMMGLFSKGLVKNHPFGVAWCANLGLCISLIAACVMTFRMFQDKKNAYYSVCVLDIAMIILLHVISGIIYKSGATFTTPLYRNLQMLGQAFHIPWQCTLLYMMAPIHWFAMWAAMQIKKDGISAWKRLK